jgi:glucose-6-phosphate dehydrogenase assembly protein OpcA
MSKIWRILEPYTKERLFNVGHAYESHSIEIKEFGKQVMSCDTDSISDMREMLDEAASRLDDYADMQETNESCIDEWRDLATDLFDRLPKKIQEEYIDTRGISEKTKKELEKYFRLEVLKKL